jgi:hypothetical protein
MGLAVRILFPAVLFAAVALVYRRAPGAVAWAKALWDGLAERRALSVALVFALAFTGRLALLPWLPMPTPLLPDEFCHLLSAETIGFGRLANPTPAFWEHFENTFILYVPAYQGKYPLGQAVSLALGNVLFGHPWLGVLLMMSALCAATCWMLQGWVPARWALLGGLLMVLRYAYFSEWIHTYMGGGVAGTGGALALGALARLRHRPGVVLGAVLAVGTGMVLHTRPYEFLIFSAAVGGALLWRAWQQRGTRPLTAWVPALATAAAVGGLFAGAVLYQNLRITGDMTMLPYQRAREVQGVPQSMYWEPPVPQPPLRFARLRSMYEWQRGFYERGQTWNGFWGEMGKRVVVQYDYFLGYHCLPALLAALLLWRDGRVRFLAGLIAATLVWNSWYPFHYGHYFAPLAGAYMALILIGFERLARWTAAGFAWGECLVAVLVVSSVQTFPHTLVQTLRDPPSRTDERFRPSVRSGIERRLRALGGRHLVFVRTRHPLEAEDAWYYNGPDLEASSILWAQEIDAESDRRMLAHYTGRRVWTVQTETGELEPYRGPLPPEAMPWCVGHPQIARR